MRHLALALLVLAAACKSDDPMPTTPTTTLPRQATITVAVEGNPLTLSGDPTKPILASWVVVVRETSGLAGNLVFVNTSIRDLRSGASARPTGNIALGLQDLETLLGTRRIAPNAEVKVPMSLAYGLVSGNREVQLKAAVQVESDNGSVASSTAEIVLR